MGFALRDAIDVGFVQAVELAFVGSLLSVQAF